MPPALRGNKRDSLVTLGAGSDFPNSPGSRTNKKVGGPNKESFSSNAQMSGFGGEAEILCSTRALPVLTDAVEKVSEKKLWNSNLKR